MNITWGPARPSGSGLGSQARRAGAAVRIEKGQTTTIMMIRANRLEGMRFVLPESGGAEAAFRFPDCNGAPGLKKLLTKCRVDLQPPCAGSMRRCALSAQL